MRKVVFAGAAILFLWMIWAVQRVIFYIFDIDWLPEKLGPWGDTFGALSSLFSAAAFLGAIYAIYQQQMQIDQARKDQEVVNEEARAEQHRQRFETSYFELLKLLRELRNEVEYAYTPNEVIGGRTVKGRTHIHKGGNAFRNGWGQLILTINERSTPPDRTEAGRIYNDVIQNEHEESFSPYFRLLYTILIRIRDDVILDEQEKYRYARLLRSQLTSYELAMAGINGLSPISRDFSDLLTHFRMFKYIPPDID